MTSHHSTTKPRSPSWRLSDEEDPLSCLARRINRDHVELILACTPAPDDYIPDFATRLVARAGFTKYQAEKVAIEGFILSLFPRLIPLFLTGVFTPRVISKLLDGLGNVPEHSREHVESDLLIALEPRIARQQCLSTRSAGSKLEKIMRSHCPDALPEQKDRPKHRLETHRINDEEVAITLFTDPCMAGILDELVCSTAVKYDVSNAQALEMLILGQSEVSVCLNLYKDISSTSKELFSAGGWLQGIVSERWLERVTDVRTIGPSSTDAYSPTAAQRAFLEARDIHCRFPGCEVPAHKCEVDHIHRFADGGPTHTDNLHLLCKHHHQLKTAGVWDVTRHKDSTEVWTSHGDGHTVSTQAEGPLARTTFEQRLSRRRPTVSAKPSFEAARPWDHMIPADLAT